jgi:hypothetical protein
LVLISSQAVLALGALLPQATQAMLPPSDEPVVAARHGSISDISLSLKGVWRLADSQPR